MSTGTFAYRKHIHLNRYDVHIVRASLTDIVEKADGFHIAGSQSPIASLTAVRGAANSLARMKRLATKHGATLLEDAQAVKAIMTTGNRPTRRKAPKVAVVAAKSKRMPPANTNPVKGWRLQAFKPAWGLVKGNERWYNVGTSPSRKRVLAVQQRWIDAGYICRTKELRPRVNETKDTLWDEPSEPIVSRIPDDPWVGDHIGPHLRKMGMTLQTYRDTFNYTGPAMVNRAAKSLKRAHESIRRGTSIRPGQMVAAVNGDRDVDVYQVTDVGNTDVQLTAVSGTSISKGQLQIGDVKTISRSDLVTKYKTLETWPNSTRDKETK